TPSVTTDSVQLEDLPKPDSTVYDQAIESKWERFIDVRDEVLKALETARKSKVIGNSLGASVQLFPEKDTAELLSQFTDLDQLFIVSAVKVNNPDAGIPEAAMKLKGLSILVEQAEGDKCERCWV